MYSKDDLLEIISTVTGKDFDDVSIIFTELFGEASEVELHFAHNALVEFQYV